MRALRHGISPFRSSSSAALDGREPIARRPGVDLDKAKRLIESYKGWYGQMDLLPGLAAPGSVNLRQKLAAIELPESLEGKSVLEIGPADGFFCFECERRGAERVVGLDYVPSKGFVLAKEILGSQARLVPGDVARLTPEMVGGEYDITIFLSVLHHLSDHLGVLKCLRRVTRELLILETPIHPGHTGPEALLAVPEAQKLRIAPNYYADDYVDLTGDARERSYARPYYLVNCAYVLRMLDLAGFTASRLVRKYELERNGGSDLRAVFHASP